MIGVFGRKRVVILSDFWFFEGKMERFVDFAKLINN
jgi:hypothetical protein